MKTKEDYQREFDQLIARETYLINNFCNVIGCKGCMHNEGESNGNTDCECIRIGGRALYIEINHL